MPVCRVCGGGGLSGVQPVAQAIVLRRVLMGGISANRCLVARAGGEYGRSLSVQESVPVRVGR
jgi:hypothetical protein